VIDGVHVLLFSPQAEAVRTYLADVLGLDSVDAGGGWPIFGLPGGGEAAVHPEDAARVELHLLCDDIAATVAELQGRGAELARPVEEAPWGLHTALRLPDGSELGLYQPLHPRP
jgi:catechol 2,3-dioxygenase-like lactoylglutathione lyase family enzyme